MTSEEKFSKISGNPYGTDNVDELNRKMNRLKKQELLDFAAKLNVKVSMGSNVQDVKASIVRAFNSDPRRIDVTKMPKPKKFDIDLTDNKVRRLFNL